MTLSKQQISIISENPLNDTLDRFRIKLGDCDQSDQLLWDEIASLVGALVSSTAAFRLPSPDASGNVATRLFSIQQRVRGGGMTLEPFRPLISSVVDNAPDVNIWDAVLSLIDTLNSLTPPPSSIVPTYKGTPVKTSSSRLADSETRDIVERGALLRDKRLHLSQFIHHPNR
ncbi:kinase [Hirsutella rhossiliensis]